MTAPADAAPRRLRQAQRIVVVGCIGAGKSTLARRLGAALDLPVVHLDRVWWRAGTTTMRKAAVPTSTLDPGAFRAEQRRLAAGDRWIIDGGYTGDLDTRLPRAELVVFLDLPRRTCAWRLLRRSRRGRPDVPDGATASVGWLLAQLRWIWRYPRHRRPVVEAAIARHAEQAVVVRVRSARAVEDLVHQVVVDG